MKTTKSFLEEFKEGFKEFGKHLSIIVNSILLLLVYLIGVGITSLIAKLTRKKFLDTKLSKNKKSYWSDLNLKKKPIESYFRQF